MQRRAFFARCQRWFIQRIYRFSFFSLMYATPLQVLACGMHIYMLLASVVYACDLNACFRDEPI